MGQTSPTLFNIVIDTLVGHWLPITVEDEAVIHDGLWYVVGRSMGILYADDGHIGSLEPEWLKGSINVLIGLFCCIRLMANVAKYKMMICQPGTIRSEISEEAVGWRSIGKGSAYRERLKR